MDKGISFFSWKLILIDLTPIIASSLEYNCGLNDINGLRVIESKNCDGELCGKSVNVGVP